MKTSLLSLRRPILHRTIVLVCVAALVCASAVMAQRTRRRSTGPRALALLELAANGRARLVPIAILINGKFYDAGDYRADPRPMALDPQSVYEAMNSGDSVGLFTVTNAQTVKDVWIGVGQWRANNAPQPETKKAEAAPPAADTDAPPILRRPKPEGTPETKPDTSGSKPSSSTPEAKTNDKAESKPAETVAKAATPAPPQEEDSDRPILRRGKPTQKQEEDEMAPLTVEKPGASSTPTPGAPTVGPRPATARTTGGAPVKILTAISDANGPEPKPFLMQVTPGERAQLEARVRATAYAAIQKFASTRPLHKPGVAAELYETNFQIFDINYNNEPVMVMTASLPALAPAKAAPSDFHYYVALVMRQDMYGELHQLFAQVTDTSHLDAYARMELIDAVDAEGTGSGQLLFRRVSDTGYTYAIYRIGMDRLWPLFESSSKSF